jgi:hypothetical protein
VTEHHADAIALVEQHLGADRARELRMAIDDADRVAVIRDAFLAGRDREAITLVRELDRWGKLQEGDFRFLPCSTEVPIEPRQSAQITARPQTYAFRGCALLVSDVSRDFLIADIRVGTHSQFLQAGDVPADVLTPIPPGLEVEFVEDRQPTVAIRADVLSRAIVPLDMEVCQAAQDIIVVITNVGNTARPWRAVFLGKDVPEPARTDR